VANALAGLELLQRVAKCLTARSQSRTEGVLAWIQSWVFAVFFLLFSVIALLALNRNEMDAFDLRPLNRLDTILAQL
jgi:hypothetical protein